MSKHGKKRLCYLLAFLFLLGIEVFIGLFVHDRVIRPYGGDLLVIVLLCCLVRIVFTEKPKLLGLYMMAAGVAAELIQLLHLPERLGLDGSLLGTLLGSTFDWLDILSYCLGGLFFLAAEYLARFWSSRRQRTKDA